MRMLGLLAGMAMALATPAAAQEYPTKPIRIVVPFGPGTATDIVARTVGAELANKTGQPVVIENKAGAEGQIGAQAAATAAPDGYTLFITTQTTQAMNVHIYKSLPYDPVKSFAPISGLSLGAQVVMVKNELPVKTIGELIALARAQPGKLSFGSGNGSSRGGAELFRIMAKVDLLGVPYKTQPQAISDLMGDRIDVIFPTSPRACRRCSTAGRAALRSPARSASRGWSSSRRSTKACRVSRCGPGPRPMRRPAHRGRSSTS